MNEQEFYRYLRPFIVVYNDGSKCDFRMSLLNIKYYIRQQCNKVNNFTYIKSIIPHLGEFIIYIIENDLVIPTLNLYEYINEFYIYLDKIRQEYSFCDDIIYYVANNYKNINSIVMLIEYIENCYGAGMKYKEELMCYILNNKNFTTNEKIFFNLYFIKDIKLSNKPLETDNIIKYMKDDYTLDINKLIPTEINNINYLIKFVIYFNDLQLLKNTVKFINNLEKVTLTIYELLRTKYLSMPLTLQVIKYLVNSFRIELDVNKIDFMNSITYFNNNTDSSIKHETDDNYMEYTRIKYLQNVIFNVNNLLDIIPNIEIKHIINTYNNGIFCKFNNFNDNQKEIFDIVFNYLIKEKYKNSNWFKYSCPFYTEGRKEPHSQLVNIIKEISINYLSNYFTGIYKFRIQFIYQKNYKKLETTEFKDIDLYCIGLALMTRNAKIFDKLKKKLNNSNEFLKMDYHEINTFYNFCKLLNLNNMDDYIFTV